MSKSITIRNVPGQALDELATRAAGNRQSLQAYLRGQLVALAEQSDNRTLLEAVRERKLQTGSTLSTERILELRDAACR